nr:MAG TPA: hypothetical protein [Caudoviricetes sp.]
MIVSKRPVISWSYFYKRKEGERCEANIKTKGVC